MSSDNHSNNKRIAKNTIALYFRQILMMLVTLYTSRVVLQALGVDDFGIYNVVGGVVMMFSFITGTLASASQRFLAYDIPSNDETKLKQTFSLIMLSYIILSVATVVLCEGVAVWFLNAKMNIPEARLEAANWVLQFSILSFVANIMMTPYMSVIIAREKMDVYAYIGIVEVLLRLLIVYILVLLDFDKLKSYAVLMFACSLSISLFYKFYCNRKFKESHFVPYYNKERFLNLCSFAWWNIIGSFANVLRSQGINILLNLFFNPAVNAARGIAYQVNGAITHFYTNFYTAVRPQVVKSYAIGDYTGMHNLIFKSSKFAFFLIFIIATPIFFYADTILTIWLKTPPDLTVLFVQTILINALCETLSMPLVTGLQAANKIKEFQLTVSVLYLLNLPISYVFLKLGYPPVTPMIINIVIVLVSLIPRILICRKYINISIRTYSREVLLPIVMVSCVGSILSMLVSWWIKDNGQLSHAITGAAMIIVVSLLTVYAVGVSQAERIYVVNFIKQKISKK